MKTTKRLFQLLGVALATAGLMACNSGSSGGSGGGETGQMSLAITDGPVDDAERVLVRFSAVEFNPANGDRFTIEFDEIQTIDLLAEAQGDQSVLLFEDEEIPAGEYNWMRLRLEPDPDAGGPPASTQQTTSRIVFKDGGDFPLFVPGGLQAGLQTVGRFEIEPNESHAYTVDIDLRKAIIRRDNPAFGGEHYKMRRALRLRLIENIEVGHLSGTVDPAFIPAPDECVPDCPGMAVYVFEGPDAEPQDIRQIDEDTDDPNNPVVTANVHLDNEDGLFKYTAGFLAPGIYTVALTDEADLDDPAEDDAINFLQWGDTEVFAGETTEFDFVANGENGENDEDGDEDGDE